MKEEEIKAIARAWAESVCLETPDFWGREREEQLDVCTDEVALPILAWLSDHYDILPKSPETATETWWLARDYDGELYICNQKPELSDNGIFVNAEGYFVELPDESFPSIAPKKCYKAKITITPTEE